MYTVTGKYIPSFSEALEGLRIDMEQVEEIKL